MNPQGIYATTTTKNVGFSTSEYQLEFTDIASSLSWDGDMSAYALGYINPDQLPNSMAISKVFITEEDNVDDRNIVIQRIKPTTNAQITFVRKTNISCSYMRNDDGTVTSGNLGDFCFINNLYPEFVALLGRITIHIKWFLYVNGTITSYSTPSYNISFDGNNSYYSWLEFKNGRTLTADFSQYGTFDFGYNDFEKGRISGTTSTGAEVTGFFVNFNFNIDSRISGYGSGSYNFALSPLLNYSGSYEYGEISGDLEQSYTRTKFGEYTVNGGIALYQFTYNSNQGRLTNIHNEYGYGDDVFNVGDLKSIFMGSPRAPIYTHIYTDSTLVVKESNNDQVTFFAIRDFDEIDQCIALYSRFTSVTEPPVSYLTNKTYCCDVDANNKFSIHFKTGDINDESFKAGLQQWQYIDRENDDPEDNGTLNTNDFDPTDPDQMPPYEPEPPTPEPGEEGNNPDNPDAALGQVDDTPADQIEDDRMNDSRTVFGANAFITQYVLTLGQLVSLGQYLWSNITDPNSNGLKNFVAIFSDTGTFNSANCLQCFVSLKVFPFDMFNTVYSNAAPDLRAGSGYTALLAESVTVFSSCTYSIDCGTVDVTADGYNIVSGQYDFRNYVNTTICVFLPFCGTVELNPADVFGFTLSCTYYIDVSSGTCTACVFVDRGDNKRLMVASKSGQIGFNIPMSATNAMQVAGTFLSDAASAAQTISDTVLSIATSRALGSIGAPVEDAAASQQYLQGNVRATSSAVGKATSGIAGAISGLGNMMSRSGCAYPSLSGGTGMAALFFDKTPYVVIRRSNYSSPNNYAHTTGFATTDGGTEHKSTLGAYAGWTVVKNCDLKNIHANREEMDEIKHLLETGVFL